MILETTAAYIATVGSDHTITLPKEMPIGAKVAVVLVPDRNSGDAMRRADFEAALALIRSVPQKPRVEISDEELDALIEEARKANV